MVNVSYNDEKHISETIDSACNSHKTAVCRTQDFLMESDQIKCDQCKFILFSSLPCTLDSVGFHENNLNVIDSRCVEAVCWG